MFWTLLQIEFIISQFISLSKISLGCCFCDGWERALDSYLPGSTHQCCWVLDFKRNLWSWYYFYFLFLTEPLVTLWSYHGFLHGISIQHHLAQTLDSHFPYLAPRKHHASHKVSMLIAKCQKFWQAKTIPLNTWWVISSWFRKICPQTHN
jgi:hypothetical protein